MRKRKLILSLLFLSVAVLVIALFLIKFTEAQSNPNIIISELMYDPPNAVTGTAKDSFRCTNDSSCQWLEIYNKENFPVDLSNWKIKTTAKVNNNALHDFADFTIQPKEYVVIATQLGDEDSDWFSFSTLYGNKDNAWDPGVDGFRAFDSNIPHFVTADIGPDDNPIETISLINSNGDVINFMSFIAHQQGPSYFVQKNNGFTMEFEESASAYFQSLQLGGSPGEKRNKAPQFLQIPNITIQEDYKFTDFLNITKDKRLDLNDYITDNEDDPITFSVLSESNPLLISCSIQGSFLNCTNPAENQLGQSTIKISATDSLNSVQSEFKITVEQVNDPPTITSTPPTEIAAMTKLLYQLGSADLENQQVTYSLVSQIDGMKINATTGLLEWTPTQGQIGKHQVTVRAVDSENLFGLQEFEITVNPLLDYKQVDLKHDSRLTTNINDSDTITLVKTNEEIDLSVEIINRHPLGQNINVPIEDIFTTVRLLKNNEVILQNESKRDFNLNSLETKTENFSFTIPRSLQQGIYTLEIETEGILIDLDENLAEDPQALEKTMTINLDTSRNRHDTYISEIKEIQQQSCTANTTIEVTIANLGTASEDDIILAVTNETLNLSESLQLPRIDPEQSYTARIELENKPGTFDIQALIRYNNDENTYTKNLVLTPCIIGDFNKDSCINGEDTSLLSKNFGLTTAGNSIYDINSDGMIDFDDFILFADNFGRGCAITIQQQNTTQPTTTPLPLLRTGISAPSSIAIIAFPGITTTKEFSITNNNEENATLVSFEISGLFSDDSNSISFSLPQSRSIMPNSTGKFILTVTIPEDMDVRDYTGTMIIKTGEETKTSEVKIQLAPKLCDSGIVGNLEVIVRNPDRNEEFEPGEKIPVEFSVKNNGPEKEVSAEIMIYNLDEDDEIESESIDEVRIKSFSIERDDFETEITLPDEKEIGKDELALIIKVFEDSNEDVHCSQQLIPIRVKRLDKDVKIASFDSPEVASCGSEIKLSVTAENQGEDKDESVYITLQNNELNLDLKSETFLLEKFYKAKSQRAEQFIFTVPETQPKEYLLEAKAIFDNGDDFYSETKTISIECEEFEPEKPAAAEIEGLEKTSKQPVILAGEGLKKNMAFEASKALTVIVALLIAIHSIKLLLVNITKI